LDFGDVKMIAITGGGTGGHLAIANALKVELNKRGIKPIYIGSTYGQDKSWFENDKGFEKSYFLDSKGVVNKKGFQKITVLLQIIKEAFYCKKILKEHKIEAIFCVGGYSAAPASFASILSLKPLYIHEQNALIGMLNKILRPFAKEFFSSYDTNSKVKDYPVNHALFETRRIRKELKTVIFLGGSQGAKFINQLAINTSKEFLKRGIKVIHQTGKSEYEDIKKFYIQNQLDVVCFDFSRELINYIQEADFAISRAGASTLWELCANALPTLFIPYPYAANNHQLFNTKFIIDNKMGFVKEEKDFDTNDLFAMLEKTNLEEISTKLYNSIQEGGIGKIADIILKG
jgi:UDP-N-acetylglucosamine--N-acetylmuramyl-(pentapeptide) pyrophosphoryl-undecaprenol N-acetylglucosamine transferase